MYSTGFAEVGAKARRAAIKWGLAAAAALNLAVFAGSLATPSDAAARGVEPGEMPTVSIGSLPPEAQTTYQLIHSGGPFPYQKDGTVFLNRERLLPSRNRGYYREYTVKTPRARNRGARRIVCGGPAKTPEHCYYTADHYASFSRISAP